VAQFLLQVRVTSMPGARAPILTMNSTTAACIPSSITATSSPQQLLDAQLDYITKAREGVFTPFLR
jgi:hypothetical protein